MSITIDGLYTVISGVSIIANHPSRLVVAVDAFTDDVDGGTLRIEDSTLVGGDTNRASYGLIVSGVFDVSIARSQISSGDAGAGRDGSGGGPEDVAARGGGNADESDGGGGYNPGGDGGSAFAGKGKNGFGSPSSIGGTGGKAGKDGGDGISGSSVGGGLGGAGGSGVIGESGQGSTGNPGFQGRGGGGGGGKVGLEGGGGGGGGEGGRPGRGGGPGSRGYFSIGVYADLEGTLVIDESIITAGRGGDGGTGGVGGVGQSGASAGQGAPGSCSFLGCGAGQAAHGGDGGGGGAGSQGGQGGGGAGGAAIGLFVDDHSNTVLVITQSEITGGNGGNGGAGGYGGLSGEGASGRSPGTGLVPGTEANAAQPGSDGGSSYGLYIGGVPAENVTIEGSEIAGGTPGESGDAPIPGQPGISAASND